MSAISYIQINIFAIIILLILLFHFRRGRADKFLSDQLAFEWMLLNNIVILALDVGTGIIDGQVFEGAYAVNMAITVAFYAVNPVMGFLYCIFCEIKLETPKKKLKKLALIYSAPVLINALYCIVNIFTPVFFMIDENNIYNRGPSFWFSFFLSYILIFYIFFKVLLNVRKVGRYSSQVKIYWSLLVFPLPPLIGSILQVYLPGVSVIWVSAVISMLIIYVNIQNTQMSTDAITGLFNRKQMMPYLEWKAVEKNRNGKLYIILMDMDGLKYINDNYGHIAGDESLKMIAEIIKSVIRKNDFAGRYGGDEFILIVEREDEAEIPKIMADINDRLKARNEEKNMAYRVSVSGGYVLWDDKYDDIKDYISLADERMYRDKKRKSVSDI